MMRIWEGDNQVLVGAADEVLPAGHTILKRLGMLDNIILGEGSQFFTLAAEKELYTVAELAAVGTFTGKLSSEEILQKIKIFLIEKNLNPADIQHLITGRNGNTTDNLIYNDIGQLFPSTPYSTFKDICGEYPTASAFGMWKGLNRLEKSGDIQYLLIYNHYYTVNHSLILLKKC